MESIINWITNNILSILNLGVLILLSLFGKNWVNEKKAEIEKSVNKELEEIKLALSREQFIHKLQFEKEFNIYSELWENLIDLKEAIELLIPITDIREAGKSEEEIKEERLKNVRDAYINVQKGITRKKPFYDKEVYKNANEILKKSISQGLAYIYPSRDVIKHYEKAKERTDQIKNIINNIEEAIRKRIRNIGEAKLIE